MKTRISEKGQITVPVALRNRLGLKAGMTLEFDEESDCLVARPCFDEDEMMSVLGCAKDKDTVSSSQALLEKNRGYRRSDL